MIKAILSDADGTLVDTVNLIRHGQYEAAITYLSKQGIPEEKIPSYETYAHLLNQAIGGSARHTLEQTIRALYKSTPQNLENLDFDKLHELLNPIQDLLAPSYVKAYAGLAELLTTLGSKGTKFAIFTSGTAHHVVRNFGIALPELGIRNLYMDPSKNDSEKMLTLTKAMQEVFGIPQVTIVTADDTIDHKPHPASLCIAMKRLGVTKQETLVLGDHAVDMQAAVNAEVPVRIGISHGFTDAATLKANGATDVIDTLTELIAYLK